MFEAFNMFETREHAEKFLFDNEIFTRSKHCPKWGTLNCSGTEEKMVKRPRPKEIQPVERDIQITKDEPIMVVKKWKILAESFRPLAIAEFDVEGAFVKIKNKGASCICLEGYNLKLKLLDKDNVFKLINKQPLVPNGTMTFYSSNAYFKNNPSSNLVVKDNELLLGDAFRLELADLNDEIVVFYEGKVTSTKEVGPVRAVAIHFASISAGSFIAENLSTIVKYLDNVDK
uniref:LTD domain-containing protein n=1 Tax=Strongyloides venezuelensis TaxID=75913 RepID=A0A0K0FUK6_STRVS